MTDARFEYKGIVSLTASLSETLFAIGAGSRVIGVTDTCDFPEAVKEMPNVSCWFDPDLEALFALKPDLVLGLESAHATIRTAIEREGITVILSNPATVDEALEFIETLGTVLQVAEPAGACVADLKRRLARLDDKVALIRPKERVSVSRILDIDGDGLIVAGPKSFQYDVIHRAGGRNVSQKSQEAYPKVTVEQFCRWDPDLIFFCGYDRGFVPRFCAEEKWRSLKAVLSGRVYQFDCALTCRTGPRIVDMAELLHQTLYEG